MGFYISETDYNKSIDKQSKIKPMGVSYTVISIGKEVSIQKMDFKMRYQN